jgi:hypothetical protein
MKSSCAISIEFTSNISDYLNFHHQGHSQHMVAKTVSVTQDSNSMLTQLTAQAFTVSVFITKQPQRHPALWISMAVLT